MTSSAVRARPILARGTTVVRRNKSRAERYPIPIHAKYRVRLRLDLRAERDWNPNLLILSQSREPVRPAPLRPAAWTITWPNPASRAASTPRREGAGAAQPLPRSILQWRVPTIAPAYAPVCTAYMHNLDKFQGIR